MAADIIAVTERLVLRGMTDGDAPTLAAYRSDPVQARYQSWETPYPVDSARALIAQMRHVRFGHPGCWLQVAIETAGRVIGDVAVRVDGDDPRLAEVGFTLAADAQGRGFATEALRTVMSLLFEEHGVHRVFAECDARNFRSAALLERVGMRREAHHRKSAWWKGEWTDEYVYAILAEEWRGIAGGRSPTSGAGRGCCVPGNRSSGAAGARLGGDPGAGGVEGGEGAVVGVVGVWRYFWVV